jgi:hypothetical protein
MALGAWLADEPLTLDGVVGAVLVMTGVWFGALSSAARRPLGVGEEQPAAKVESA